MRCSRKFCGLLLVGVCQLGAARGAESFPEESLHNIQRVPFDQLSERSVSQAGVAALDMKSIKWEHSESTHFIFHTETGFAVTQLVGVAEWSYAAIKQDLGIAEDAFERKCHLYVFLTEPAWREFVGNRKMDEWTGGWCTGRELFFRSRPHFKFQGTTLPHELTHLVLYRFVGGDIPLCLNEGLAEFEGGVLFRRYLKLRNYGVKGGSAPLSQDHYIPLNDLLAAIDYPKSREAVTAFYAESQRLVSFLCDQFGGMARLMKLIQLQSRGSRFDTACREVYGSQYRDLEEFESKFTNFVFRAKD